jgi:hypothetical protein
VIVFTDLVRVLDYITFKHPEVVDAAFEELVSIVLEMHPAADRTYLVRPDA